MEIGMEAATRLMHLIENTDEKIEAPDNITLLKPELLARDSTNKAV